MKGIPQILRKELPTVAVVAAPCPRHMAPPAAARGHRHAVPALPWHQADAEPVGSIFYFSRKGRGDYFTIFYQN